MNVFYEEEGDFKVGAVLSEGVASLQVEAPHGKRSKVKAGNVLVRFEGGGLADFLAEAGRLAAGIDLDFLWECCGADEFAFDALARDYFGRAPTAAESAALLVKLHGAPMYFYKRGKGRYRAAPAEALRAALASVERKRREARQQAEYVGELSAGKLPEDFRPLLDELLYRPEKTSVQWKALDAACTSLKVTPARLMERCGALASAQDYHLRRFLFEHFPRGTAFGVVEPPRVPQELALAEVEAFSIDDVTTTEIDDAFSVTRLAGGNVRVGIHIAAPALAIAPGSQADSVARERLSTVYYPGGKITMLPEATIAAFTLVEGRPVPALSLYLEISPGLDLVSSATRVERVPVAANLRHDALEVVCGRAAFEAGAVEHRYGAELMQLWRLAGRFAAARGREAEEREARPEYSFHVEGDRVRIVRRQRGAPIDRLVSELMIHVNSTWGRELAARGAFAIYRVQNGGKVRMSTVPAGHQGLGVEGYAWASSPLRRYVDLVNQRQVIAVASGVTPPHAPGDAAVLAAMRDFEEAHEAYGQFQRNMERYFCLRWLAQEGVETAPATVMRESLVRLDDIPLVLRVPSLPALEPGVAVRIAISRVDLIDLTAHGEFAGVRNQAEAAPAGS
ncbi:MAG: RNB domain-containing ribonuclease [Burkholderiales bacterium]|nr:RNB domain-containing ribonuclease [Burkholderiales bacterium]